MRRFTIIGLTLMVVCAAVSFAQAPTSYWDMQSCDFCKTFNAQPGLFEHLRFEYHNTSSGMVGVIYIDPAYRDKFTAMLAGQRKVHNDLMSGKLVKMCEHCSAIEDLFKSGAKIEPILSEKLHVTVFSSDVPETIAKIHYHADRCRIQNEKDNAAVKK